MLKNISHYSTYPIHKLAEFGASKQGRRVGYLIGSLALGALAYCAYLRFQRQPLFERVQRQEGDLAILIVGRTRSGKTAAIKSLQDPFFVPPVPKIYSGTRNVELNDPITLAQRQIHVLDSPGLGDVVKAGEDRLTNAQILSRVDHAVEDAFGGYQQLSAVILTISLQSGVNKQGVEAVQTYVERLPASTKKILMVTHMEGSVSGDEKEILGQMQRHSQLSRMLKEHFADGQNVVFGGTNDAHDTTEITCGRKVRRAFALREGLIEKLLEDTLSVEERSETKKQREQAFEEGLAGFIEDRTQASRNK